MIDPLLQFRSRLTDHERVALDNSRLLTSVIRGFVKTLTVPPSSSPIRRRVTNLPSSLTLISRLSSRRAGTRFNSRGIDDDGNVSNFVETETVFWSPTGLCFSYTQVRGSVPIFWESSSSLIPGQQKIQITRSPEATQPSFDKHFARLERTYGAVHIVNLLSTLKPGEAEITERYRYHIERSPLRRHEKGEMEEHNLLRETEFDFHEQARVAGGYEGAKAIRPYIDTSGEAFVYFLSEEIVETTTINGKRKEIKRPIVIMQQNGVFRVNCLDCLDRTNLVQGIISQMAIELFLSHRGEKGNADFWMRHSALWADNGDALSKIYAGTGALKSSFTRYGKMSLAGALADARKSATRLYVNHFEDKNRQNTVDLLLGRLVGQNSVDLYDPVNDWVVAEVARRRTEFETRDHIKVWVGTYNLNGKTTGIKEDLSPWLKVRGRDSDVMVVGFQEIVELSPQQIMSTDPNRRMAWESAVQNCLNDHGSEKDDSVFQDDVFQGDDDYVLLRSGQLVGAALMVFVRSGLLGRIKNVEGAIKKTGMSGIAGNKGAVAIRMEIESTSVCFVTAHLAAGFANYEERNRDYNTITTGLRFQRNRGIEDHEVVVWAGDFNYRIGLGYDRTKALVNDAMQGGSRAEESLGKLYENDQLNIQMVVGNCFNFYREGRVRFLPTYKYDLGKDEFDSSEKQRIPAWTDRVVWKVNQKILQPGDDLGTKMKQLEYDSVMAMRFSDHRPVYAIFETGIRVVDQAKKDALIQNLYRKRAQEVKSKTTEDVGDEDSDSEEMDELMGYQSIQEGLPPASSDRRKWWLDGDRGARSTVGPPRPGLVLNRTRESNPWREGREPDWVEVERPAREVPNGAKGFMANGARTRSTNGKPQPPPPRTARRMVPPVWEGEREASPTQTKRVESTERKTEMKPMGRPTPPTPRNAGSQTRAESEASTTSSSTTAPKKQPPPKPAKPLLLSTTSSKVAVPANLTKPEATARHLEDENPPPLPKRTSTVSSVASASRTAEAVARVTPPAVQPRAASRAISRLHGDRDASVSSVNSRKSLNDPSGPPLPPRPSRENAGLLDSGVDEGMEQYKPLVPS